VHAKIELTELQRFIYTQTSTVTSELQFSLSVRAKQRQCGTVGHTYDHTHASGW